MDLHYFVAPNETTVRNAEDYLESQIGFLIQRMPTELSDIDIAIFSVEEDRGSMQNLGCAKAGDEFRKYFYSLRKGPYNLKIADLGVLKAGDSLHDTYFAVQECLAELMKQKVLPIIIGGSVDLTYANYMAYGKAEQMVNMVAIDSKFALSNTDATINSENYLSKVFLQQPNVLFNYSNLAYQTYFIDQKELELVEDLFFDIHRLGVVKGNIQEAEPIVRNADFISFSINAIAQTDAPANKTTSPNGLNGEMACQLSRYAGISDKLSSIGFYDFNPSIADYGQTAHLLAQMVWYFVDGYYNRKGDFPACNKSEYTKYTVAIEEGEQEINFYKSAKSDRWWMDVPYHNNFRKKYERHLMLPCSYSEYQTAIQNEIPERWFQTFKKLK